MNGEIPCTPLAHAAMNLANFADFAVRQGWFPAGGESERTFRGVVAVVAEAAHNSEGDDRGSRLALDIHTVAAYAKGMADVLTVNELYAGDRLVAPAEVVQAADRLLAGLRLP